MIIKHTGSNVETIGDIKENEVSIDPRNLSHIITILSSNLYSNPEESFLRETISNAWDSHIEAGSKEPIILSILKQGGDYNKCTVAVRDYGTGISPERFNEIYLNIGSSTKRDSNEFIGHFGIGRFSALACSNVVSITSYYEGTAYYYIMMRNNDKINIDLVNKESTIEKNGVEVKITGVSFSKYISNLYKLSYMPNLYVNSDYDIDGFNERVLEKHKTFNFVKDKEFNSNYILYGNVMYKFNTYALSWFTSNSGRYYANVFKYIQPKFEIGELDVTPNREDLLYSDRTLEIIDKRFKEVINELTELCKVQFNKDYDDIIDYWKVYTDRYRVFSLSPQLNISIGGTFLERKVNFTYRGLKKPLNQIECNFLEGLINLKLPNWSTYYNSGVFSTKSTTYYVNLREILLGGKYRYYSNTSSERKGKFLVLPSFTGTKGNYFKDWIREHYSSPLLVCTPFADSIRGYINFLINNKVWNQLSIPKRKMLWITAQLRRAVLKNCIFTDIINSKEYQEYKTQRTKEVRAQNVHFNKQLTFYVLRNDHFQSRGFTSTDEIVEFFNKNYKNYTILYGLKDDYRFSMISRVYDTEKTKLTAITVAKSNLRYLKLLPSNFIPVEDFINKNNAKYLNYLSKAASVFEVRKGKDSIAYHDKCSVLNICSYLPKEESDMIKEYLDADIIYDNADLVQAIKENEPYIKKDLYVKHRALVESYLLVLKKLASIKGMVTHSCLIAYFGMKNKLLRMNYTEYKRVKKIINLKD